MYTPIILCFRDVTCFAASGTTANPLSYPVGLDVTHQDLKPFEWVLSYCGIRMEDEDGCMIWSLLNLSYLLFIHPPKFSKPGHVGSASKGHGSLEMKLQAPLPF